MVTPSTNLQTDPSSRTDVVVNKIGPAAGYEVAKGASVNLDVVSIHHDATVFSDPGRFDPDRFDVSQAALHLKLTDFSSGELHAVIYS